MYSPHDVNGIATGRCINGIAPGDASRASPPGYAYFILRLLFMKALAVFAVTYRR